MSQEQPTSLNLQWAQWMVEELYRLGCTHFYLGCGSRSTPLTVAAARHGQVKAVVCYDERGAAFRALGYARGTGKPAVVVTTSGTAVANLYPAVVEASMDNVPLIVISCDRPPELIDTGANQAIQQTQFFSQYVRWQCELPCARREIDPAFVLTTLDQAVARSQGHDPGPVHINWMIREPFLEGSDALAEVPSLANWQTQSRPFTQYACSCSTVSAESLAGIAESLRKTKRGLLLVGRLDSEADRQAALGLMGKLNWPVYADLTSGLRLGQCGTHMMRHFDQELMRPDFSTSVRAETVLHLGGRVTSKRVGLFFKDQCPDHYIQVQASPARHDPIHRVTDRVQTTVADFATQLTRHLETMSVLDWSRLCTGKAEALQGLIQETVAADPALSEPYVARRLTELIPDQSRLFVSNSMPIRDVDLYGTWNRSGIRVAANRGASGIDGILATAIGYAEGTARTTTLLIGDMALIHDLNSLAMLGSSEVPLVIVAINNRGGGIFRFLPIAEQKDVFKDYFLAPHDFSFGGVAQTFGCDYTLAQSKTEFDQAYQAALKAGCSCLIEVETDSEQNHALRKRIKMDILDLFKDPIHE